MLQAIQRVRGMIAANIPWRKPWKSGVTQTKREREIIISLTSHPPRIESTYMTINTLLQQDLKPDRVILWLAREQFPNPENLPRKLLRLQKYGLEIRWYHDIRSYKKLIPALKEFPDAVIVTVDDDCYYPRDTIRILVEEFERHPMDIICHAITHPKLGEDNHIHINTTQTDCRGTSKYIYKMLGCNGVLYTRGLLDDEVFNETCFMTEAPTNDDIYFWAMAVKKGTKIRQAKNANENVWMTDPKSQYDSSLGVYNLENNLYEQVNNRLMELYPEILDRLLEERQ